MAGRLRAKAGFAPNRPNPYIGQATGVERAAPCRYNGHELVA
jgi:hypothetical protein